MQFLISYVKKTKQKQVALKQQLQKDLKNKTKQESR